MFCIPKNTVAKLQNPWERTKFLSLFFGLMHVCARARVLSDSNNFISVLNTLPVRANLGGELLFLSETTVLDKPDEQSVARPKLCHAEKTSVEN